jgi:hypothetical protein
MCLKISICLKMNNGGGGGIMCLKISICLKIKNRGEGEELIFISTSQFITMSINSVFPQLYFVYRL